MSGTSLAPQAPRHLGLRATLAAILGGSVAYAAGCNTVTNLAAGGLAAIFLRIALIDFKLRVIYDRDVVLLLLFGLIWICSCSSHPIEDLALACARGAGYVIVFLIIRFSFKHIHGREGLGIGDVKLIAASAPVLIIENFGYAVELSSILGFLFVFTRAFINRRKISQYNYIPLGFFLSISICIIWFFSIFRP